MASNKKELTVGGVKIKQPTKRLSSKWDGNLQIKACGERNDYPYVVQDLIESSVIGRLCAEKVEQFLQGNGFSGVLANAGANTDQTFNDLLSDIAHSISYFGGAYLHIQRNALCQIASVRCLDYTTVRLGETDSYGRISHFVVCADWTGRRITRNKKEVKPNIDKRTILPFTPNVDVVKRRLELSGGISKYAGEILYITNRPNDYALPYADSCLQWLSADAGLQQISYRAVRSSFLPSTILTVRSGEPETDLLFRREIEALMGDESSSSIVVLQTNGDIQEDTPKVVDFHNDNYGEKFEKTRTDCNQMIYNAFNLDTYYRAVTGGFGFSTDVLVNAFNLQNMQYQSIKNKVEKTIKTILKDWTDELLQTALVQIQPLVYNVNAEDNRDIITE